MGGIKYYDASFYIVAPDLSQLSGKPPIIYQRKEPIKQPEYAFAWSPTDNQSALYLPGRLFILSLSKDRQVTVEEIAIDNLPTKYNSGTGPIKAYVSLSFSGDGNQLFFHLNPWGYKDGTPKHLVFDARTKQQVNYDLSLFPPDKNRPFYPLPNQGGFAYWLSKERDQQNERFIVLFKNNQFTKFESVSLLKYLDYPDEICPSPDLSKICFNFGASGSHHFILVDRQKILFEGNDYWNCLKWLNNSELVLLNEPTTKIIYNTATGKQTFLSE